MSYNRCTKCDKWDFMDRHTCPPPWRVYVHDYHDVDNESDCWTVHAASAEDAAESAISFHNDEGQYVGRDTLVLVRNVLTGEETWLTICGEPSVYWRTSETNPPNGYKAPDEPGIARLDQSKPPPKYKFALGFSGSWWWQAPACSHGFSLSRDAALADAWADHQKDHDPPGLELRQGPHGLGFVVLSRNSPIHGTHDWPAQARAAAWQHYWSAVRAQVLLDEVRHAWATTPGIHYGEGVHEKLAWPMTLHLTVDEQAKVLEWLTAEDGEVEMPEVLRG